MNTREKLIIAAINVIEKDGMDGFTMRRVAAVCGVSCAAPYKHFASKEELFSAVLDYVDKRWEEEQSRAAGKYEGDLQKQLTAVSIAYIRFITDNPHFRAVNFMRDERASDAQRLNRAQMNSFSRELVSKWCMKAGYTHEQSVRKTYMVRAMIFGAIMMFESGELEYTQENMDMVEKSITREFALD
jgi:AcrR family transcriptional regulator